MSGKGLPNSMRIIEVDEYGKRVQVKCDYCGKTVRKPVYAPAHEETTKTVPYHKRCLDRRAAAWERSYN
jgi:hypothetical protein